MKNMRKIISLILTAAMVFSFFALTAAATQVCNHNYSATPVAPTCVEDGYTLFVCGNCGDNYKDYKNGRPALGHTYGSWKVLVKATCEEEGYEQRDCSVCGASEVKTIGILTHTDADTNGKCDYCNTDLGFHSSVSPFDWLIALFNFIRQWFADLFA